MLRFAIHSFTLWESKAVRSFWLACLCCWGGETDLVFGDDFSVNDGFYAKLSAPMNAVVDGKPFRDAILSIADQAKLNVCIDRRVDPSKPVSMGAAGPNVYGALAKLAAGRGCVVLPISNVLLIGRPEWVDATGQAIWSLPEREQRGTAVEDQVRVASISWDDLTTPIAALEKAVGGEVQLSSPLPHDMWPRTRWTRMRRDVAVALVLAQFDLKPNSTSSLRQIVSVSIQGKPAHLRRYSASMANAVRPAMSAVDSRSRFRLSADWLVATGSVAAHRKAAERIFASAKAVVPDPDVDTFTLKKMETNAGNALRQLSQTAGLACEIDSGAEQACQTVVTLEGTDATLRELIELVAKQAGVQVTWRDDSILIQMQP